MKERGDRIVTDNHMHLYNNLKLKALKQFRNAGGTHVFLVSLLSTHYDMVPTSGEDFRKIFDFHLSLVRKANEIVKVHPVLAVHPAEITILGERIGYEKACEIMKEALAIAGEYVAEGKAVAIKSGRPHYKVSKKVWEMSNEIMGHAFSVAKDCDCAVQIHTESYTSDGMKEIAEIARKSGIKVERVVKHFAPPAVKEFEEIGLFPSVIAFDNNILKAAEEGDRFFVETDYIDDKSRPGAILGPKTVPRRIRELYELGYEDVAYKVCVENVEKIYKIELDI
ncbi:putative metal-dependent hydrolase (urease superfamily) [Archaeoglobus sulfaticallidus PM70-1]|uniref:Putative metal-dependent hydrolase (Urease superfamily) n=1 Tax=Archaeoglobus sulfaticallidus PM70-1 TaxID=387631 RepID=N0BKJ4_9EURY|nr:TatD family hydrolase [Archaeoglobus sulfaticallidus]AGK61006.1 putative metal-dependent hydrolase (urease superfamily) [Archaeoglobus sulfaticallidus PM70-1]